ncbi:MAG: 30S ribosomal protein S1 [Acidobacteriaceae bacterium]|nr:30S ribosomal protein S1 [Acidobacteriaceae bacterium]MBV9779075.1 30S ribosomal protein S1 [Acidobacteriaceae bacterium]
MSNLHSDPLSPAANTAEQEESSFAEMLSDFDQQHADGKTGDTVTGTIVSVSSDAVLVDIGRKIEGSLPRAKWDEVEQNEPKRGASVTVTIGPRNEEGYYDLSMLRIERPKDWAGLQKAFDEKRTIAGVVVEQVKGGYRVDVGVRAFMPASRSGVRDAAEMPALVGQEIQCRITKLDVEKEDLVIDRRVVLEEEELQRRERAFADLKEGAVVRGRVRSVMDFGAFIDLGGVDALLHVADISHSRVNKAGDAVKIGDELEVKILKTDPATKKLSVGLKQLQEDPWTVAARTFHVGDRVSGTVSRLADFGAFIELLPGVDGLIHLSELSWDKRVRKPGDLLKVGERVEAVILQMNIEERRISLGYKQVLGDPWDAVSQKFPVGSVVEGPVTNLTAFGAFVDLGDGIEGMVHISDITHEKRLNHSKDKLAKGQPVKAAVIEIDRDRRRIRLSMKQLEPTSVDHYISDHRLGDTVNGRLVEVRGNKATVELGEGVLATCQLKPAQDKTPIQEKPKTADVSSLSAMLAEKWKQGGSAAATKEAAREGQVRSFRIANLDPAKRLIELELAS